MIPVRDLPGFFYGVAILGLAVLSALVIGTIGILPWIVLPRGKRERRAIPAAGLWADLVVRGLLMARPTITGRVNLPGDGGALFLCNHRSWLDTPLLVTWTHSQGLSKSQIFWIPFIGISGWLTGAVFFDRRDPEDRKRAREEVMFLVRSGARVHVFPEGTRSRDGELGSEVRLTLAKDCFAAGLPVVPCAVWGTDRALPVTRSVAVPFQRCRFDIGEPLFPKDYPDDDAFARACWAEVVARVARLKAKDPPPGTGETPDAERRI